MPKGDKNTPKTHIQFLLDFEKLQPELFNNLEIVGGYKGATKEILVKNKYGVCKVTPSALLKGHSPSIQTAIDKTAYFINQAKDVHGDLYDYSLVNYKNSHDKIFIISSYQTFGVSPNSHLQGSGCSVSSNLKTIKYHQENPSNIYKDSSWITKALKSKNLDSFKVYIIKCYNDTEIFYKIGKTFKTTKQRFNNKKLMPYKYQILDEIIFDNTFEGGKECCEMERELQNYFKRYQYTPSKEFGGKYECFYGLPLRN